MHYPDKYEININPGPGRTKPGYPGGIYGYWGKVNASTASNSEMDASDASKRFKCQRKNIAMNPKWNRLIGIALVGGFNPSEQY